MRRLPLLYALVGLAVVCAARADSVLLTNGNRFDDVLAAVAPDGAVTIRFSYGELQLPRTMILRVERSESGLAAYLAEFESLEAKRDATAEDWLDLALRARAANLEDGYRRALRRAADLDPAWPGLAPHMRAMGLVHDARGGRWVTSAELAALETAASRRATGEAVELSQSLATERRRLLDALELLALAELAEELGERRPEPRAVAPVYAVPTLGISRSYYAPFRFPAAEHNRRTFEEMTRRQPGSLLPVPPAYPSRTRVQAVLPD